MTGPGHVLFRYFRKEWRALGVGMGAAVLLTLAELAAPFPLAIVVDRILDRGDLAGGFTLTAGDLWLLAGAAALLLAVSLVQGVVSYASDVSLTRAAERIVHELRLATHVHLQRLSLLFHARRHTGDLVTRVTGDVNAVGRLFAESLASVTSAVLILAGMMIVSLVIDPVLALVAFAVTPLLALVSFRARRQIKHASREARRREGEIASLTAESLAAIREVKAFGSEPFEHGRLRSKSEERLLAGYDVTRIQSRFARVVDLIGALGTASVLVVGVFRVSGGAISPGELVVMVTYAGKVYRPLRTLAREVSRIAHSMARAERITEVLAADDVLEERPDAYEGPRARGGLDLDAVSFSYEADRPALVDASLRIEPGEKVALVGRSGAGKSTVAAMIARFYDPTAGRVLLDGRDVRDCSLAWLRRQVGLVLQDTVLFSGTVAQNIAYGIDAGRDEIEAAAKAADAHEFISALPDGYDTVLGPRGVGLSGGQRQRIAIARTILRDPAVLILDEPTTGLDAQSEAEVLESLSRLMRGRTTLIISHAPQLVERADRAVAIEDGRIAGDVPAGPPAYRGLVPRPPRRPPVPSDPALPRLPVLLDADAMAPVLERSLGRDAALRDVRIEYVRYAPGTKAVVHYDVALDGSRYDAVAMLAAGGYLARRATKPENVALAERVDGRSPARLPLHYDAELEALIHWFPLDLELPALAEPPARLLAEAGANGTGGDEPAAKLRYKPRRRAVLRVGGHVLKVYAKQKEFTRAAYALRAVDGLDGLRTAQLEGQSPAHRVTVQPLLDGSPPEHPLQVARSAGALLACLQAGGGDGASLLPAAPPSEQLRAAADSASFATAIRPALRGRLERLVGELAKSEPSNGDVVLSHGDFSARQLLVTGEGLAVVDLDALCLAPPAFDPATFAAHLVSGGPDDLAHALEALEQLVQGYGSRPDALGWYLSTCILRHARWPFRYLEDDWPERLDEMVGAAEIALEAG